MSCVQETAAANGVTAMPTFMFFRNKTKIDTLRGADAGALEEKIRKWYGSDDDKEDETVVKGQVSITFICCPFVLCYSFLRYFACSHTDAHKDRYENIPVTASWKMVHGQQKNLDPVQKLITGWPKTWKTWNTQGFL